MGCGELPSSWCFGITLLSSSDNCPSFPLNKPHGHTWPVLANESRRLDRCGSLFRHQRISDHVDSDSRKRSVQGSSLAFWERRALRILPLAFLYLVALFVLVRLGDPLNMLPRFDGWAWYAFYLGNIHIAIYGWQPLAVMILWSLAIEEQFYLVWPFLVRMYSARHVLWWSIGLIVMAPFIRA